MLASIAVQSPDDLAFEFAAGPRQAADALSFSQLDEEARLIAADLLKRGLPPRTTALLAYPPGLEFLAAFFGCMYAGVIPAPVMLALTPGGVTRMAAVVRSAGASLLLANSAHAQRVSRALVERGICEPIILATDEIEVDLGAALAVVCQATSQDTAFLQFSSGSTGDPKGVAISHGNVLHNISLLGASFGSTPADHTVSWLPHNHDMGLIAGIMHPISVGMPTTLMSPAAFARDPLSWLELISSKGATMSGGPNFAYQRCLEAFDAERLKGLDLSRWTVAISGAEPVRPDTLDSFARTFGYYGFERKSLYPTYGLAEATLMVSGASRGAGPRIFESGALSDPQVSDSIVAAGPPKQGVLICEPTTLEPLGAGKVGEILVSGGGVSAGYWDPIAQQPSPVGMDAIFPSGVRYIRTGDLGAIIDGELCIVGRLKDVVIFRGRNVHPHDVERLLEAAAPHTAWRTVGVTGVQSASGEGLGVFIELTDPTAGPAALEGWTQDIRARVWSGFEQFPHVVVYVGPGQLPHTTSGKLQRGQLRDRFAGGSLTPIAVHLGQPV